MFKEYERLICGSDDQLSSFISEQWINIYARINVVNNTEFVAQWSSYFQKYKSFEKTIANQSVRGNSRDESTPWVFYCHKTVNCTYQAIKKCLLKAHESVCSETHVNALRKNASKERIPCLRNDCDKNFASNVFLTTHVKDVHEWQHKSCKHNCESSKLYVSRSAYQNHMTKTHSDRWFIKCLYNLCISEQIFNSVKTIQCHLRKNTESLISQSRYNIYRLYLFECNEFYKNASSTAVNSMSSFALRRRCASIWLPFTRWRKSASMTWSRNGRHLLVLHQPPECSVSIVIDVPRGNVVVGNLKHCSRWKKNFI